MGVPPTPTQNSTALTIQSILSKRYAAPRLVLRDPVQLHTSEQVVNYILDELNTKHTDEKVILSTALEMAYKSARRDIFLPLGTSYGKGIPCSPYFETIARQFVMRSVAVTMPMKFASLLGGLLAYGVNFGPVDGSQELASLVDALHCLHQVVECVLSTTASLLGKLNDENVVGNDVGNDKVCCMVENGYKVLALLHFFARKDRGDTYQTLKAVGQGRPARYTVEDFYTLFKSNSVESSGPHPIAISASGGFQLARAFSTLFNKFFDLISAMCRDFSGKEEIDPTLVPFVIRRFSEPLNGLLYPGIQYCQYLPFFGDIVEGDSKNVQLFNIFRQMVLDGQVRVGTANSLSDPYIGLVPGESGNVYGLSEGGNAASSVSSCFPQSSSPQHQAQQQPHHHHHRRHHQEQQQRHYQEQLEHHHHHRQEDEERMPLMNVRSSSRSNPMFIGLKNSGNTCFISSFTQLFFAARRFRVALMRELLPKIAELSEAVKQRETQSDGSTPRFRSGFRGRVTLGFVLLLAQMHWRLKRGCHAVAVNTEFFRKTLPPPFNDGRQHDASEYAKVILEFLDISSGSGTFTTHEDGSDHERDEERVGVEGNLRAQDSTLSSSLSPPSLQAQAESTGDRAPTPSVVARWFGGTFASFIECHGCHRTRTQCIPFWDVSVPLRRDDACSASTPLTAAATPEPTPAERTENCNTLETQLDAMETQEEPCSVHSAGNIIAITRYPNAEQKECPSPHSAAPPRAQSPHIMSLQELVNSVLDYQVVREVLQGENAPLCDTCSSRVPAIMRTAIHATRAENCNFSALHGESDETCNGSSIEGVPFYLTLQLNRFQFDRSEEEYEKVMDAVRIEEYLNVNVRVVSGRGRSARRHEDEERRSEDGEETVWHCTTRYRLIAVLVHSGLSPRCGHYFALLRRPCGGSEWLLANDSMITPLSEETMSGVLSGNGGVLHTLDTPYILLYERCDNGMDGSNEDDDDDDVVIPESIESIFEKELQEVSPLAVAQKELHGSGKGKDGADDSDEEKRNDSVYGGRPNSLFFNFDRRDGGGGGPIY